MRASMEIRNFDGLWQRDNKDTIVLEVKTSTWPIGSVSQLGEYLTELSKKCKPRMFAAYM